MTNYIRRIPPDYRTRQLVLDLDLDLNARLAARKFADLILDTSPQEALNIYRVLSEHDMDFAAEVQNIERRLAAEKTPTDKQNENQTG